MWYTSFYSVKVGICFLHRHILGGVEYSLELCTASSGLGLGGGLFKLGFGTVTKANSNQMAADFINERIRKALAAAHVSSSVVTALQVSMSDVGVDAKCTPGACSCSF